MPGPVWMASPPDVHSALLSAGPGPGPLLAAAGAWSALSTEYLSIADELTALVAAVRSDTWAGSAAEAYAAANVAYGRWLLLTGAQAAAMATRLEIAAAAYAAALAAMPTLAELAANHAAHAALVATNFFGINTIPIALNETDYVRMWIQAATTMTSYQAVSGVASASAPHPAPAPPITKPAAAASSWPPSDFGPLDGVLNQLAHQLLSQDFFEWKGTDSLFEIIFPPGTLNPGPAPPDATPLSLLWPRIEGLLVYGPEFFQMYLATAHNPVQTISAALLFFTTAFTHLTNTFIQIGQVLITQPAYLLPFASAIMPAGSAGLAGLAGLAGPTPPVVVSDVPILSPAVAQPAVAASAAPATVPTAAPPVGSMPTIAAAPATAAPTAGSPPPATIPPPFPYLVSGPGSDAGSGLGTGAKTRRPSRDRAAVAGAATASARVESGSSQLRV